MKKSLLFAAALAASCAMPSCRAHKSATSASDLTHATTRDSVALSATDTSVSIRSWLRDSLATKIDSPSIFCFSRDSAGTVRIISLSARGLSLGSKSSSGTSTDCTATRRDTVEVVTASQTQTSAKTSAYSRPDNGTHRRILVVVALAAVMFATLALAPSLRRRTAV